MDESKIKEKFDEFKTSIIELNNKNDYEKFKNPFLKILEGIRKYPNFEIELNNYLENDIKIKQFFFTIPYFKAIVLIVNHDKNKSYDNEFFENVLQNLNEAMEGIEDLLNKSIKPTLYSFSQWNKIINCLKIEINEKLINNIYENEDNEKKINENEDNEKKMSENEDLYNQYKNIQNVFEKIKKKIAQNINFIMDFRTNYTNNKNKFIDITKKELTYGLKLESEEEKELEFFNNICFLYVFEFLPKSIKEFGIFQKLPYLIGAIVLILASVMVAGLIGLIGGVLIGGAMLIGSMYVRNEIKIYISKKRKNLIMENESITSNIFSYIIRCFIGDNKEQINRETNEEKDNKKTFINTQSIKDDLLESIYENVQKRFKELEKLDIIKFLLFVDNYLSNQFWDEKISNIFEENFQNIYIPKFNENLEFFKENITINNKNNMIEQYNLIFNSFWDKCLEDCNNLKNKKDYDEKTGINSIEHLLRKINPDKITEEIINETFIQILKYKIILKNGYVNKLLFKDCFIQIINIEKIHLEQTFSINFTTRIDKEEYIEISNLKQFIIQGFEIPNVDASFF